jgi:two-component system sensor histidine kinase/response regulator
MDRLLLRALETAAVGIVITDRQGVVEWINPGFTRLTGYSWDEIVGKSLRLLRSGKHSQSFFADLWSTILSGSSWEGEIVNRRKDGDLYVEEQVITPVRDGLGAITHFIAIKQDVTARRGAEQALRESEVRYHTLIQELGEGVVSADSDERVLTANPAAESIMGVAPGTLAGCSILDFIDPADWELLRSESASRQRGEKNIYELRIIRADGERRVLQITATPQFDASGNFRSSLGILRDITSEKALTQRLNLLAHSVESVDECISICGPDDRLLFVNRAFLRTYGYEEKDLLGHNVSIIRSPLNSTDVTSGILPATLAGGWHGELWNRRKDGTDFQIMLTTAAVVDEKGNLEATVGVARDITERKREEAELRRAKEEAESANRVKSEFLATMSHEIRTPMNGVIGMTGLLLDTALSPEQREYAETVRTSGEALLTVINDILDFSKMEAGKLQVESFPFDLRLVMEEVNEMLAPRADEKSLGLVLEYSASHPRHFIGDAGRVRQVVTNLVGNAVKFTPTGHVLITVDCLKQDAEIAHMQVSVKDTGVGIPQDRIDTLFEKFSQVDGSTTRKYGGTGLGLAIARQLTELMGGSIDVESRLTEGSTFRFMLPLHLDPQAHTPPVAITELKGQRVLIVDDHEVNRRVLHEQITGWGMRSVAVASAAEALRALSHARNTADPYAFVLLDYQMPEMDGGALATAIKKDPLLKQTVVIMLTSIGQWSEVNRTRSGVLDACLAKPVRQSQLLGTMTVTWARKKAGPGAGRESEIEGMKSTLAGRFSGSTIRILLAEDNVVNQKVAARMLERLGLRVDVAANGREAVEMCEMLPYDLVLMDCQMPEMDGYEATREIRRRASGRPLSIVAMTADAMVGTRERCIEAGMNDHIAKPIKMEDLFDVLQKWTPQ